MLLTDTCISCIWLRQTDRQTESHATPAVCLVRNGQRTINDLQGQTVQVFPGGKCHRA